MQVGPVLHEFSVNVNDWETKQVVWQSRIDLSCEGGLVLLHPLSLVSPSKIYLSTTLTGDFFASSQETKTNFSWKLHLTIKTLPGLSFQVLEIFTHKH